MARAAAPALGAPQCRRVDQVRRQPLPSLPLKWQGCPGKVEGPPSKAVCRRGQAPNALPLPSPPAGRGGGEGRVRGADEQDRGAAHLTLPSLCDGPHHLPSLYTPLRAERGSLIPYPFWKWPAAQAAVLMRNKHREIAIFVCSVRSMKETIGSGQHEGELYISRDAWLSERNHSGNPACSCPEETGRSGQRGPTAGCCRPTA
jgi:hypothetical protein